MNSNIAPVALITGGAKRLGALIAKELHHHNYDIIIHYRSSSSEADVLVKSLNQIRPDSAITCKADFNQLNELTSLINTITHFKNRLDLLVHNASSFYATPIGEINHSAWDDLMNSNLKAAYFLSELAAPFLKQTNGTIITINDIHGELPLKRFPIYSIAKAGLIMMTKVLAKELAPEIRVNGIAPGPVIWPDKELTDEFKNNLIERTLLKRKTDPNDLLKLLLFLAQQQSMTGKIIHIDSGRLTKGA